MKQILLALFLCANAASAQQVITTGKLVFRTPNASDSTIIAIVSSEGDTIEKKQDLSDTSGVFATRNFDSTTVFEKGVSEDLPKSLLDSSIIDTGVPYISISRHGDTHMPKRDSIYAGHGVSKIVDSSTGDIAFVVITDSAKYIIDSLRYMITRTLRLDTTVIATRHIAYDTVMVTMLVSKIIIDYCKGCKYTMYPTIHALPGYRLTRRLRVGEYNTGLEAPIYLDLNLNEITDLDVWMDKEWK